jgi:site-specific DNA recombinase
MTVQVLEQGRYEGGRVPYGLRLVDGRPHPNRRQARRGICLQHFAVDPTTGPVVEWMFSMRQEGFSLARITRALNDAAIPYPSAEDPKANPHRTGKQWTLGTVREILLNPVYTGRMVWGRSRTARELADPDNPGLGHIEVRRRNTPDKWAISPPATHQPLVSDAGFIAVQNLRAERADAKHDYRLRGLLRCALCERAAKGTGPTRRPDTAAGMATTARSTPARPGRRASTCARTVFWPSCRCCSTCSPPPNRPRPSPAHLPAPPAPLLPAPRR